MELEVTKLNPMVEISYQTEGAAGLDLCASIPRDLRLGPGECVLIPSGIAINIRSPHYAGLIIPRSGLGHFKGLVMGNGVGLIDSDYQGEIRVSLLNRSNELIIISPLMRIAQLIIVPIIQVDVVEVAGFQSRTKRAAKGFGSTGTI